MKKYVHFTQSRQNMLPLKSVAKSAMISHNFVASKTPGATSGVTPGANMNVKRKLSDNMCDFQNICLRVYLRNILGIFVKR